MHVSRWGWIAFILISLVMIIAIVFLEKEQKADYNTRHSTNPIMESADFIQNKIDDVSKAGGGIVKLPEGTFLVNETIILRSNVHLKGSGIGKTNLIIKAEEANGSSSKRKLLEAAKGSLNIKISNLSLDGANQQRKDLINHPDPHTISLPFVKGFEISEVEIVNSTGASLMLFNSEDGLIKNCIIRDSGSNGIIGLQEMKNIKVINNDIRNVQYQNGIYFSYQEGRSSSDILIEGNTVQNIGDYGIEVGHLILDDDEPHKNIQVKNNMVSNTINAGIGFRSVKDGVIENNIIVNYGVKGGYGGDGIFVEGREQQFSNVRIEKNKVVQKTESGDANGIYITGMREVIVTSNEILNSNGKGIFVQASKIGSKTNGFPDGIRNYDLIKISHNLIEESEDDGVHFQGYFSKDNEVLNNVIRKNKGTGILIANIRKSSGITIQENQVERNGEAGLMLYNQSQFTINGNSFFNNGQFAESKKNQAAISLISVGDGSLSSNQMIDNQTSPTQKFYLSIRESQGRVIQREKRSNNGSRKLFQQNSPNYKEIE